MGFSNPTAKALNHIYTLYLISDRPLIFSSLFIRKDKLEKRLYTTNMIHCWPWCLQFQVCRNFIWINGLPAFALPRWLLVFYVAGDMGPVSLMHYRSWELSRELLNLCTRRSYIGHKSRTRVGNHIRVWICKVGIWRNRWVERKRSRRHCHLHREWVRGWPSHDNWVVHSSPWRHCPSSVLILHTKVLNVRPKRGLLFFEIILFLSQLFTRGNFNTVCLEKASTLP